MSSSVSHSDRVRSLARLRAGVEALPIRMTDAEVLRFATASSLRCGMEAIEWMYSRSVQPMLMAVAGNCLMTPAEYNLFYGIASGTPSTNTLTKVCRTPSGAQRLGSIEKALMCTLKESAQSERWQSDATRCATAVALSLIETDDALQLVIGDVIRTDKRRLDDVRADEDEVGSDVITLVLMVDALVEASLSDK